MRLILNKDVENLGSIGEVVSVRNGYARNFLLPRGFALMANEENEKALEFHKKRLAKRKSVVFGEAKTLAATIEKTSVTVAKQVGEDEKIFGSVTSAELETLLGQEGIKVSKKDITLTEEVKKVGVYTAQVKLHPEISAKFKVWVVAQ